MTLIMDGNATAKAVQEKIAQDVEKLKATGKRPGLAVVLVGEEPASKVYVGRKKKPCEVLGFYSKEYKFPADTKEADLLALVETLNRKPEIHGILVQLPLPARLNPHKVIETITPDKDVDGMHPTSLGKLVAG